MRDNGDLSVRALECEQVRDIVKRIQVRKRLSRQVNVPTDYTLPCTVHRCQANDLRAALDLFIVTIVGAVGNGQFH
jgi:hypothetical protein